jgi:tripartite-type tricarboxylate transporter receptor subunit TctC
MQRRHFTAAALGAALLPAAHTARAQAWPQRPIKVLQGFAAGGNADTIARLVSTEMAKNLGQPMVVEAVAGAGGTLATGGHAVAGALYEKLPYQTVDSFQMVSTITFFPFLIVTQPDTRLRTVADIVAAAKVTAGGLAYGTAGVGSTHHLIGELLARQAGAPLLHVPFRGDSASITALLGGEIPFVVAPPTAVLGQLKAGKLRALAVTGPQRWSGMPEVPTVAEQGVAGFDVRSWAGWMLPAGTPQAIVQRLHEETQKALQLPAVRARLEEMGGEARGSTPQEMATMVAAELQRWSRVVAEAKIPRL